MKRIENDILNILDSAKVEENLVTLTCGQLDRKTYLRVNKVLDALGGKWNRKLGGHVFQDDPAVRFDEAILTGTYSSQKQDFGFFETPPDLARRVVELAQLDNSNGMTVLEPSAGRGALANVIAEVVDKASMFCIDILPENAEHLRENGFPSNCHDFLTVELMDQYDRVIMNPPFATNGTKQADIDHVQHAWKFVKDGGKLVSIMSASIEFRTNKKTTEFRNLVNEHGWIEAVKDGAFKASGTMVRSVIVVLERR